MTNSDMLDVIDGIERVETKANLHHSLHGTLIECSDGDARKLIDLYQTCCAMNINSKKDVYKIAARPEKDLIQEILQVAKTSTRKAVNLEQVENQCFKNHSVIP